MTVAARKRQRIEFRGVLAEVFKDESRFLDIEGALNCGKTTVCLWKEFFYAWKKYPGIHTFIGRFSDGDNSAKLKPAWMAIARQTGVALTWDAKELCYQFPNGPDPKFPYAGGSKVYSFGLKAPDELSRYAKLRGLGVSRIYIDQGEELPPDFFGELVNRLRQPGFPHQLTLSPNPLGPSSWLALEFPADNSRPNRRYYAISLYDNAHNLPSTKIEDALSVYPETHVKHKTMVLGQRGMNVTGEPVYKGAFQRHLHEVDHVELDPYLPLEMALDFGKHHPCVVFAQHSVLGQLRFLGGILGQQMYLDDFLDRVLFYRERWFKEALEHVVCADPAGLSDTSQGTRGARDNLEAKGFKGVLTQPNSNSPAVRLATVERLAALMRRRAANGTEALVVSKSERWLRVSEKATVMDRFLADGFEAGYVWDEHVISVNNKPMRRPKKDGWFEHGQNCSEYLELNFGVVPPPPAQVEHFPLPDVSAENAWMV